MQIRRNAVPSQDFSVSCHGLGWTVGSAECCVEREGGRPSRGQPGPGAGSGPSGQSRGRVWERGAGCPGRAGSGSGERAVGAEPRPGLGAGAGRGPVVRPRSAPGRGLPSEANGARPCARRHGAWESGVLGLGFGGEWSVPRVCQCLTGSVG